MKEENKKPAKKSSAKKQVKKSTTKKTVSPKKPVEEVKVDVIKEVVKEEETKTKKNDLTFKDKFFPLLLFSLVTSIVAVGLAYYIQRNTNIYSFSAFNDFVYVESGLIATTHKENAFEGNNIGYRGQDIMVSQYEIGYYVMVDDFKTPIITTNSILEEPKSLKAIVNSVVGFDFTELKNEDGVRLDKEVIDLIKSGNLYFIITYNTSKSEQTVTETIELKLNVNKF